MGLESVGSEVSEILLLVLVVVVMLLTSCGHAVGPYGIPVVLAAGYPGQVLKRPIICPVPVFVMNLRLVFWVAKERLGYKSVHPVFLSVYRDLQVPVAALAPESPVGGILAVLWDEHHAV